LKRSRSEPFAKVTDIFFERSKGYLYCFSFFLTWARLWFRRDSHRVSKSVSSAIQLGVSDANYKKFWVVLAAWRPGTSWRWYFSLDISKMQKFLLMDCQYGRSHFLISSVIIWGIFLKWLYIIYY